MNTCFDNAIRAAMQSGMSAEEIAKSFSDAINRLNSQKQEQEKKEKKEKAREELKAILDTDMKGNETLSPKDAAVIVTLYTTDDNKAGSKWNEEQIKNFYLYTLDFLEHMPTMFDLIDSVFGGADNRGRIENFFSRFCDMAKCEEKAKKVRSNSNSDEDIVEAFIKFLS